MEIFFYQCQIHKANQAILAMEFHKRFTTNDNK